LEFRKEAEKRRQKATFLLEDNNPKFYVTLWQLMSLESREQIKQHSNFVTADLKQNPNSLVIMARDTHLTNIHGGGNAMRTLQKETKKAEFNAHFLRNLACR
jgi:hypothetical protein